MSLQKQLLHLVRSECKKHNIRLYLGRGRSVRYPNGMLVNGFFDFDVYPKRPLLSCAKGKLNWELTLVHELSHLQQWIDDCPEWIAYTKLKSNPIDSIIAGDRASIKKKHNSTRTTLLMERDCEKRAHATLKLLGYPKEKLSEYVQKANAYTLFYFYIAKHGKWYKIGHEPYTLYNVWSKFPKTFDIDIDRTFKKVESLYDQCVS